MEPQNSENENQRLLTLEQFRNLPTELQLKIIPYLPFDTIAIIQQSNTYEGRIAKETMETILKPAILKQDISTIRLLCGTRGFDPSVQSIYDKYRKAYLSPLEYAISEQKLDSVLELLNQCNIDTIRSSPIAASVLFELVTNLDPTEPPPINMSYEEVETKKRKIAEIWDIFFRIFPEKKDITGYKQYDFLALPFQVKNFSEIIFLLHDIGFLTTDVQMNGHTSFENILSAALDAKLQGDVTSVDLMDQALNEFLSDEGKPFFDLWAYTENAV